MLRLLIDENFDHRILRELTLRLPALDFVLVNQVGLRSSADPTLLAWAAQDDRAILTHDVGTITRYANELVKHGQPMAGVIVVPSELEIGRALTDLEILLECLSQSELRDHIQYLPL